MVTNLFILIRQRKGFPLKFSLFLIQVINFIFCDKNTLGFFNTHCVIVAVAQLCVDMGVVFACVGWRREFDVESF